MGGRDRLRPDAPLGAARAADVIPAAIALLAFAAHLATSGRYGYFRDELYFIECAKHLAWGYVDQPPLVAFAAFLASPFHYDLLALRALPALAAALTVWFVSRIARELGGELYAQSFAALATALLPAYLLLGNTLTTTSFEPLSWTLLLYALIRLVRTKNEPWWIVAALAFTFGMYGKYSMLLLGCSAVVGLLCSKERRLLFTWWFPASVVLAGLLLAPNLVWQGTHGWAFVDVVRGDFAHRHAFQSGLQLQYRNLGQNAVAFAIEQLLYTNPFAVPIWVLGWCAFAFSRRFGNLRFIAIAYALTVLAAILLAAKGYYIIGVYAALLAAGCVFVESRLRATKTRAAVIAAFAVLSLPFVPFSLPVLPVDGFIAYSKALRLTGTGGSPAHLIQPLYAEEFGWSGLAARVATVYNALPAPLRERTAVYADTYGDAGALDFYGPRYGLPSAISAQNTYYLWGPRGYDGAVLIWVGASQAGLMRALYRNVKLVTTYGNPYKWVVEGPTPIYLCSDPVAPLPQLWPRLKWYGA